MGQPKKLRKKYSTPSHPWQKERIDEEKGILGAYGLKNKKEIWKANSFLRSAGNQAKKLIALNDLIKVIAGSFIIISLLLGNYVNEMFYLFTAFVGVNLVQSSFTKWCLMEKILVKAGIPKSEDCTSC